MRLIYADYNPYTNSIDVNTFENYILRIAAFCGLSFLLAIKITSKLSNFILHQFGGLHKLWDAPTSVCCLHFGQQSGKFFNSVSSCIIVRVLFPQVGHRTHFIVSIFFSILTSKYYPTKFIKFIATVFKLLLLDYLTAEKECFHIGLLFTCHFFVFLILYPPVQQIA